MAKEKQPKDPATQGKEIKTAADLIQDENNYRKHSEQNKARIRKSIDEAGLGRSVVIDADGVLVAGNGVQSVIDPDTPVRVIETDGTELVVVKRTDLHTDDPRRKTLALADNATSDDVEWDFEAIAEDWSQDEAGDWGVEWPADEEQGEQQKANEDDFDPDKPVETVCKKGDIWKLGNHRLMCGDSTDAASVALLMDGEKADIAFTSPPYNMMASNIKNAFKSDKVKDTYGIENGTYQEFSDNLSNEDYTTLLNASLDNCLAYCDEVLFNIGILKGSKIGVLEMLHKHSEQFSDLLVWNKNTCMPLYLPTQIHILNHICEPIFCFNHSGERTFSHSQWQLGTMHNRIDTKNANGNEYSKVHHATFPIELPFYIVQNFTEKSILDCFGGTGTSLIAAEQLNRKCYMMELDPHYCDVIIARWEKFTGNKAEKLK